MREPIRMRSGGRSLRIGSHIARLAAFIAVILGIGVGVRRVLGLPLLIRPVVALWISMLVGGVAAAFLWRCRAGVFITASVGVAVMFGTGVLIRWAETSEVPHLDRATVGTFTVLALFAGGIAQALKGKL